MKLSSNYISYFTIVFILWLVNSGCQKEKTGIHTWLEIDSLRLADPPPPAPQEITSSSRFTDAWVYINDRLVGGFELPARIPILAEGNTKVTIFPGIQVNGLTALRSPYLKVTRFEENINLIADETININHVFTFDTALIHSPLSARFVYKEDFENGHNITEGPYGDLDVSTLAFEGNKCGLFSYSGAENTVAEIENLNWLPLPKGDVGGIFFEMNYKCNTSFTISLLAKPDDPTAAAQKIGVIGINPSDTWKKIYITLSPTVNSFTVGNKFKFVIAYTRQPDIPLQQVYLDNLQILY